MHESPTFFRGELKPQHTITLGTGARHEPDLSSSDLGQADGIITMHEAYDTNPNIFNDRIEKGLNWTIKLRPFGPGFEELQNPDDQGIITLNHADVQIKSRFGEAHLAAFTNPKGRFTHDRIEVSEGQASNIIAFGKDAKGDIRIAVFGQERNHANNAFDRDDPTALSFLHIPMGFADRIFGKDAVAEFEHPTTAGNRELEEEVGVKSNLIKQITIPEYPSNYVNPAGGHKTWGDLQFVEVDLQKIEELKGDKNEQIFNAEFITLHELYSELRQGKTERHGYARMALANSAILIFIAHLNEVANSSRNQKIINTEVELWKQMKINDNEGYKKMMEARAEILKETKSSHNNNS